MLSLTLSRFISPVGARFIPVVCILIGGFSDISQSEHILPVEIQDLYRYKRLMNQAILSENQFLNILNIDPSLYFANNIKELVNSIGYWIEPTFGLGLF